MEGQTDGWIDSFLNFIGQTLSLKLKELFVAKVFQGHYLVQKKVHKMFLLVSLKYMNNEIF